MSKTLYKYLDAIGGFMMLRDSDLQFTNATKLNDPFDCHPALFDYTNPPTNKYNWPPADLMKQKGEGDMENLRNSIWLCSLSKIHDSILMWSYYGNHKGVCIGLDMEKANQYLSKIYCSSYIGSMEIEVQYKDILEKPDYFHNGNDYFHYLLSTKAKAWEHEQEVRLVLIDPSYVFTPMALPFEPKKDEIIDGKEARAYPSIGGECFVSLYLGIKLEEEKKKKIIEVARNCNPEIKIYQMTIDPDAFRLREELIDN